MNKPFRSIGLIGRHPQKPLTDTFIFLAQALEKAGFDFCIERQSAEEALLSNSTAIASVETMKTRCDLILTVGGDGNFLRSARTFFDANIPILGINRGTLGYLTDIHPQDFFRLEQILKGQYHLEKRFLLQSEIHSQESVSQRAIALNDVVLYPGELAQMIEFEIYVDGEFLYRQRSDGLIISTPTGSTAYSLSAGGPILHPSVEAILLTPMMPHSLTSRPIVLSGNAQIDIFLSEANKTAPRLNHDGQDSIRLEVGDRIHLKRSDKHITFVHPKDYDYYGALRSKLNWNKQPIFQNP